MAPHGRWGLGVLLALFVLFTFARSPADASAEEFGIPPGGFSVRLLNAEGQAENRAASHPDRLQLKFALALGETTARDVAIEMPPGFGGNLNAVPDCPRAPYEEGVECPPETQVGVVRLGSSKNGLPIFKLEPEAGGVAAFATEPGFALPLSMSLRPADFGVTFELSNPQQAAVREGEMELWGVPADRQVGTTIPRRAFLTTPSRCGPLAFTLRVRSWQQDAPWQSASAEAEEPLVGCENLAFGPGLHIQLSNPVADSPTGMRIEISAPEGEDASQLANAQIKDVSVEMPAGVTVSPRGAERLTPCSDTQFGLGSPGEPHCPPSARVGSVEMSSPAVQGSFTGTIYLGEGHPGERFRLLVAAPGPGIYVKFTSSLQPDPATGRLSTTLHDLPQVSLQGLSLNIDGGPAALLASPLSCGATSATAQFTPYGGGRTVSSSASLFIGGRAAGGRCTGDPPFEPELSAGSVTPLAGRDSAFWTILRRRDGEQLPRRFSLALPAGFSASLGRLKTCSEADFPISCPETSRIGSVVLEVGSGPEPVPVRGGIFLTGPYRGAPFGLLMALSAKIGPVDLGAMAIRAALQVDGRNGRVRVTSAPLPESVEGVPIRFQAVELNLDRPGFIRNPTSCGSTRLDASIESQSGATATASSPLAIRGCGRLGFSPQVQMAFEGPTESGRQTKLGLRVSTRLRPGDTNLKTLRMSFPKALRFSPSAVKAICSRQDADDGTCPAGSRIGASFARTPVLSEPLRGSIYVVRPKGNGLPDLSVSMSAGGIQAELGGKSATRNGHFITALTGLPDIPLSAVTIRIGSAEKGAFSLAADPCTQGHPRHFVADVFTRGQDGATHTLRTRIGAPPHCRADPSAGR